MKQIAEQTVSRPPAPVRKFNTAYTRALAAKERRAYLRLPVMTIRCRDFRSGLEALLAAFGDQQP